MTCVCSLAGTAACASCSNNPNSAKQYSNLITWTNSVERTCKMEYSGGVHEFLSLDTWTCSECGCEMYDAAEPNYCPNCGCKVVKR